MTDVEMEVLHCINERSLSFVIFLLPIDADFGKILNSMELAKLESDFSSIQREKVDNIRNGFPQFVPLCFEFPYFRSLTVHYWSIIGFDLVDFADQTIIGREKSVDEVQMLLKRNSRLIHSISDSFEVWHYRRYLYIDQKI